MKSEEYAIHSEMGFSKQEMHSKIKISFSTDADGKIKTQRIFLKLMMIL